MAGGAGVGAGAKRDKKTWQERAYGSFPQSEAKATLRLRDYYRRLGFERMGRSMFFALCPEYERPEVNQLALPNSLRVPIRILDGRE